MTEKIPAVKNPLTIIAIFSGLSEVSMTVALGLIDKPLQSMFIWFVILFPSALVVLFFVTLNFNHKVLYAPSDYRDEENFFRRFGGLTSEEQKQRLDQGAQEVQEQAASLPTQGAAAPITDVAPRDRAAFYSYVEGLLLYHVSRKYNAEVRREVAYGSGRSRLFFDGIIESHSRFSVVEVKYLRSASFSRELFDRFLRRVTAFRDELPESRRSVFSVILAVGTDLSIADTAPMRQVMENICCDYPFKVEVEICNLDDLKRERNEG